MGRGEPSPADVARGALGAGGRVATGQGARAGRG